MNIQHLPVDIIYKICTFSNIVDICKFRTTNKTMYYKIMRIESDLLSHQLRLQNNTATRTTNSQSRLELFYNWLNNYLNNHLHQYKRMFYKDYQFLHKRRLLQYYIINFNKNSDPKCIRPISNYKITNELFSKIFNFYIKNNFCNISIFKNKLLLLAFYNFLNIEYYPNYNFNYQFNFLEQNNNSKITDCKLAYYNTVLYKFHYKENIPITFDQMYTISNYVTSIPIIKKILGYKILNLSNTLLNLCCYDCNEENIIEICNMKRSLWKDDLISHNYNQFKQMLQINNPYYYHIICNRETVLINSMIYIKNPITNRRVRVNKTNYNNLVQEFDKYKIQKITKYISNQKEYFRKKYFT